MTPAHTLTAPRATRTRRSRRAALALIGALCATGVAVPAGAIGDTDGLWYVEAAGLDEIHQRTTGEGITVAVIDNRINPDIPEFEGADLRVPEDSFCQISRNNTTIEPSVDKSESADHGTNVTAMVVGNGRGIDGAPGVRGVAPGATMYFYAGGVTINGEAYPCTVNDTDGIVLAIEQAVADGADIISLSTATNMVQGLLALSGQGSWC